MPNSETIDTSNIETKKSLASEAIDAQKLHRQIGAQVLATVGFESHDIVESSFEKARKEGEKLPGKNSERRNLAYISRLERLIDERGNAMEKKLWEASVEKLIVTPKDITESYWKSQEQILRDNGQGRELSDYEKRALTEDIQKRQRESLESWSSYLGDENAPYPLWFKIYAWDGMSKMGVFDKEKGTFKKRDKHTIAPYPKINPAVLAKTYSTIATFYGLKNEEQFDEDSERDDTLDELVKSGSFSRIYSKILLDQKAIPKTPEKTEDVHGEWIEYLPGDEERLALAAEGTPWCVADPGTGRHYLEYGNYGDQEDDYYDEDDELNDEPNQAKFILFHLYDSEKNMLSKTACASIRLGTDGRVAEVSGLNDGQALEDSLVPIVEEKVKSLPGGEEFLEAFADKQELIRLDRKMQSGEDLTKEELEFIYEINRPIKTLDTYNAEDPRITELRGQYGIEYALSKGIDVDQLTAKLCSEDIIKNLDILLDHGADIDINHFISTLDTLTIIDNLDTLISHGAYIDINQLALSGEEVIIDNLDTLISHGADINQLVSKLEDREIADNLDVLISHGADIDINQLVPKLKNEVIIYNLDVLISHGADIDINQLVSKMYSYEILANLDVLISHGADIDINQLISKLEYSQIARGLDIYYSIDTLISHGADINQLVSKLEDREIADNLDILISHGAEINLLLSKMKSGEIADNLDTLISHGADINQLVSKLTDRQIAYNLDTLRAHGYQG